MRCGVLLWPAPQENMRAIVDCDIMDCPEDFGIPVPKQCTLTYSIDQCCATGYLCDPAAPKNANDNRKVVLKSNFTCNVGAKKYEEYSQYYPDELPCSRCVCMKGHDATKEDKVVPVSTTTANAKKADSKAVNDAAKVGPQCAFGDLKLNIGEKLSTPASDTDLDCTCQIPPFVKCLKTRH
ncbi:hypothetical protein WDU94_005240 [Cyamophila willieti]